MHYSDYLREQAAKYRQLAEAAEDAFVKQEFLELAAVCEEEVDNRSKWSNKDRILRRGGCGRPGKARPASFCDCGITATSPATMDVLSFPMRKSILPLSIQTICS